ncbi:ABC transporter substrate-binding protein [Bradyrhizobium sp. CCGUVB23]|uniref:ABC transporter substrate-binding protein n=1 Tax=Bradyrhizobium sp. CCGUVB23 TaxID=2949630 RepID=UPI0020B318AE|nr:ABC transporter substrate-binding protein [Bradyrhizobium sp. CCGUVB23]MCP3462641.1 ABC transporter substrate-binding protein [Bradyrhizobium sp. CCGUVB23]
MRRRDLLAGLLATTTASALRAAESNKVYRLAIVSTVADLSESGLYKPLFVELRRLGYVEGENLVVLRFSAREDTSRYDTTVRDAVSSSPDLIFVTGTSHLLLRVKALVRSIPVVGGMNDPVALGIVSNLARPEGNITGISVDAGIEILGKRLGILLEAVPTASRVGFLCTEAFWNSAGGDAMRAAARNFSVKIVGSPLQGAAQEAEYLRVLDDLLQREHADGMLVTDGPQHLAHRDVIVDFAERGRLPAIYPYREYVEIGGLMAYAIDRQKLYRQHAHYVDMIFKGAKPSELPIYQVDKYTAIINLKAARTQGITIPASLVLRADEVIE